MLSKEQKREALSKFLGSLKGRVHDTQFEQAQKLLGSTAKEDEPFLDALATGLNNGYMANSDYARKVEEANRRAQEAELAKTEYLTKVEAVKSWEEYLRANTVSADEHAQAQQRIAALETEAGVLKKALEDEGIEVTGGVQGNSHNVNNNTNPGTTRERESMSGQNNGNGSNGNQGVNQPASPFKYVTADAFAQTAETQTRGVLQEQARMLQIMTEHQQLTGKSLDIAALTNEALLLGKLPSVHWEEKFEVSKLRQERAKQLNEEQINAEVARRVQQLHAEQRTTGQAPVLGARATSVYDIPRLEHADKNYQIGSASANVVEEAVREWESLKNTGKMTDGTTAEAARMMYGI